MTLVERPIDPTSEDPPRRTTPLPEGFGLALAHGTTVLERGRVLMGGSPTRLMKLGDRAQGVLEGWRTGTPVGPDRVERILARRLVRAGVLVPLPPRGSLRAPDVTFVVPVRDRAEELADLVAFLGPTTCVVVDDGSSDAPAIADAAGGARVLRLERSRGPAAARNAGVAHVTTPLIAFVDSDCRPSADWLEPLLAHFEDPQVACVAPRIVADDAAACGWLARYESVRSSLDRGPAAGLVRPLSAIPFVPSATLVMRTDVARAVPFDEALLGGEDVDLVWRLDAAGWDVRYEPESRVVHADRRTPREWAARRAFYGTTAGPLARRHPDNLAPFVASAWSVATWLLVLARRPLLAAVTLGLSIALLARRLRGLVTGPFALAARIAGVGTVRAARPAVSGIARAWSPVLALALLRRRTRAGAAVILVAPAVDDWRAHRGALDPVRYIAWHVIDDLAYGTGVWLGCVRSATLRPLLPRIVVRSNQWSVGTLRRALAPEGTALGSASPAENSANRPTT